MGAADAGTQHLSLLTHLGHRLPGLSSPQRAATEVVRTLARLGVGVSVSAVEADQIRLLALHGPSDPTSGAEFPLTPDPRYAPRERTRAPERFEVVYVGSLAVHKGVPLLIDAVRRLPHRDLRLTLVGGWGSRGMRRFVQRACAADPRISARPGDPLERLRGASVCVHPAFEDGFAYAPAEALASGVPVIVSEDTGMKELIDSPRRGMILPTGALGALTEAIDAAYRGEMLVG